MSASLRAIKAEAKRDGWSWADWVRSEADEKALLAGHRPKPEAAQRVADFCAKFLRHSKGQWAGKPFDLLDWQRRDVIDPLFGWVRPDGTRRYRMAYISMAKKNGKSALMSALGLYGLVADNEPGAEVYSAAADREQATIVFNESANMVEASGELLRVLEVVRSRKRIVYAAKRSWFQALSADVPTKEGLNAHYILFDELHAQKTHDLFDTLRYAGLARRQPLFLEITTAGYDRHSICFEQYDYASKVRDGIIDDLSFFSYVAEVAEDADWKDRAEWAKANPSLGVTVTEEDFEHDFQEAVESTTKENRFRRYRLNQWTEQDVRWLNMDQWDACGEGADADELAGQTCYAGLDLSTVRDVSAFVLYFPDTGDVLPFFWAPKDGAAKRQRKDRVPYLTWAKAGHMELTPGNVVDYDVIRKRIGELAALYNIREIAIDRWNSTQLQTQLMGDGHAVVQFGQGFASMTAPTKELEKLVLGGKLRHGANPVLRWMASNVTVETDAAGNLKPSKKKSTEKIDGIVALVMALGRALESDGDGKSVYETRGVLAF